MIAGWIDITAPLAPGLPQWPGDPPFTVERTLALERGDPCNLTTVRLCAHTGTHIDAPLHFIAGGVSMDAWTPEATCGPAQVLDLAGAQAIGPEELQAFDIAPGSRILLRTANSSRDWTQAPFDPAFVALAPAGAAWLASRRIRAVGIDYLSIASPDRGLAETHLALLESGIWIIEGLVLRDLPPGAADLLCLPLRLAGADGAPARALARPVRSPAS